MQIKTTEDMIIPFPTSFKWKNEAMVCMDGICNELIKYSAHVRLKSLAKLYNTVLASRIYPNTCARGFIKPIHKIENSRLPTKYRGITITSVIGKWFNAVINNRMLDFIEKHNNMTPEEIAFKNKCRSSDHIFIIKALSDKYKKNKKSIYTCALLTFRRLLIQSRTQAYFTNY